MYRADEPKQKENYELHEMNSSQYITGMTHMHDIKSNYTTPDCVMTTITAKSATNQNSISTPTHSHRRQKSDSRQNES